MSSFCDEISLIDCVAIEITNIAIGAISVYVIHNFNHEKKYGFKNVWYEPKFFTSESEDEVLVEFWGYLYGKKVFIGSTVVSIDKE